MYSGLSSVFSVFILLTLLVSVSTGCTTFVVTPGASADGSMYIGHTNDGYGPGLVGPYPEEEFSKLVYLPPAEYDLHSLRQVPFDVKAGTGITGDTSLVSSPQNGTIPQVQKTYGYLSSAYGVMNEYGLMASEATDYARTTPSYDPEKRIFYSSELSNLALERCKTPVEAIELVSSLITMYGYYGSGETLIFANATEAWVMEMAGTPEGTGGVWAAQKVRDGEVFAGGNIFRIGAIDPTNPDLRLSDNARDIALREGWWDPATSQFHFANAWSAGEFTHPYHTLGRIWSIYRRIAPSVEFPPVVSGWTEDPYPFSIVPDHRLNKTEIFDLFRDHYEGTGMDLTSGLAAGPFGDPYRDRGVMDEYDGGADDRIVPGAWAYPVSAITCGYSYICESSPDMADIAGGIVWFGFAQPYETCYMPVFAGVTNISPSYYEGNRSVVSRTYGYWPFSMVTNWARLRYDSMMPIIKEKQQMIERQEIQEVDMILQNASAAYSLQGKETAQALLTNYSAENTERVIASWWDLSEDLIVRFSNGMIWDPVNHSDTLAGYPDWWYNATGYQYGPRMYRTDLLDSIPGITYSGKVISKSSEENPFDIRSDLLG